MTPQRLQELLEAFRLRRIAVFGDFFLDKYLDTDPAQAETSIETGKAAHQVVAIRRSPGAAGTVVNNLAALQAGRIYTIGAIGDDGEAYELRKALEEQQCDTSGLLNFKDLMTPTYLKPRDISNPGLSGEHERYDTKNRHPTPPSIIARVVGQLDRLLPDVDAVIIADQVEEEDCGVVTAEVRKALAERAANYSDVVFWADSRRRIRLFHGVAIKPNQFEAVGHDNPRPDEEVELQRLRQAVVELRQTVGAPVCVTRGPLGMLVSDPRLTEVPGVSLDGPLDPTGAGDSVTAAAVLTLSSGAGLPEAALVGILVASITVEQLATTGTASPEQVTERLQLWRQQQASEGGTEIDERR